MFWSSNENSCSPFYCYCSYRCVWLSYQVKSWWLYFVVAALNLKEWKHSIVIPEHFFHILYSTPLILSERTLYYLLKLTATIQQKKNTTNYTMHRLFTPFYVQHLINDIRNILILTLYQSWLVRKNSMQLQLSKLRKAQILFIQISL